MPARLDRCRKFEFQSTEIQLNTRILQRAFVRNHTIVRRERSSHKRSVIGRGNCAAQQSSGGPIDAGERDEASAGYFEPSTLGLVTPRVSARDEAERSSKLWTESCSSLLCCDLLSVRAKKVSEGRDGVGRLGEPSAEACATMLFYLFRVIPPTKWLGAFLLSFSTLAQVRFRDLAANGEAPLNLAFDP